MVNVGGPCINILSIFIITTRVNFEISMAG